MPFSRCCAAVACLVCAAAEGGEVEIEARRLSSPDGEIVRAEGDAALRDDGGQTLRARILEYGDREVRAAGEVEFSDRNGARLQGGALRYSFAADEGEAADLHFFPADSPTRMSAARARFAAGVYHLEDAVYTTCPVDGEDWRLVVDALEVNPAANRAVARAARLQIGGTPVFYLPQISFLLDDSEKKTGFLAPGFGVRESAGLEIETPFYLHLADDYDATFAPRYISERGILLQNEFRYLTAGGGGEAHYDFIPQDRLFGGGRRYARFSHRAMFNPEWRWGTEAEKVSDDDYFEDLGGGTDLVARRNFPRRIWAEYDGGGAWSAAVRAERFQTIRDDADPPHDILPQARVRYFADLPRNWRGDFELEYARFQAPAESVVGGNRYRADAVIARDFDLAAVSPILRGWRLTPRFGLAAARYQLHNNAPGGDDAPGFVAPSLELDAGSSFFRAGGLYAEENGAPQFRELLHTLETRLLYAFAPEREQSDVPLFDAAIAESTAERLFSWNRFSGGDRAGDANFIAAGIVWRIWDPARAREALTLELGQQYRLRRARVVLEAGEDAPSDLSPLILALRGSPRAGRDFVLDLEWEAGGALETVEGEWRESFSNDAAARFSYARLRGKDDQSVGLEAFAPLSARWRGALSARYSPDADELSSAAVGLEYRGGCGCWRASVAAERIQTDDDDARARFFFNIELTGLGGFGEDKLNDIAETIRDSFE